MSTPEFMILRAKLAYYGLELVQRGSRCYIRRRPFTDDEPTSRMTTVRSALTVSSRLQRGKTGLSETGIPRAAEAARVQIPALLRPLQPFEPEKRKAAIRTLARQIGLGAEETEVLVRLVS